MSQPVRYSPEAETVEADEKETLQALEEQFKLIQDTTAKDYQHPVRAVHAKAHGLAKGTLTVKADLPPELAQTCSRGPATMRRSCGFRPTREISRRRHRLAARPRA